MTPDEKKTEEKKKAYVKELFNIAYSWLGKLLEGLALGIDKSLDRVAEKAGKQAYRVEVQNFPKQEAPKIEIPEIRIPKPDPVRVEIPEIKLPEIKIPKIDFSKLEKSLEKLLEKKTDLSKIEKILTAVLKKDTSVRIPDKFDQLDRILKAVKDKPSLGKEDLGGLEKAIAGLKMPGFEMPETISVVLTDKQIKELRTPLFVGGSHSYGGRQQYDSPVGRTPATYNEALTADTEKVISLPENTVFVSFKLQDIYGGELQYKWAAGEGWITIPSGSSGATFENLSFCGKSLYLKTAASGQTAEIQVISS